MLPPPAQWQRRNLVGALVLVGLVVGPWLAIGAVIVGILFAFGVLP